MPPVETERARPPFRIFLDFFQTDKETGAAKGIVAIDLKSENLQEGESLQEDVRQ